VSEANVAPGGTHLNQRRKRDDDEHDYGGSVIFDRSYNPDIAAVMQQHVKNVMAYIDTVELYIGGLKPKDDPQFNDLDARIKKLQQVRKAANPHYRIPWFDPVFYRGAIIGWRYVVNQPLRETLFLLDEMMFWPFVAFHRFDPSYDFITKTPYRANAVRLHFIRHLILRWCRSPYMPDEFGTTTYWAKYRGPKHKRPTRNAVGYHDRPPKMGGAFAFHLDSRTIGATAIKAQGFEKPSDLADLDPSAHFARHFILAGDYWDQIETLRENSARLRHRTQDYRAQLLNKYCREFKVNRVGMEVLRLPTQLTF
jgi:hypothetical protein